jgi:hypothetical protein
MSIVLQYDNDPHKHTRMLSVDAITEFMENGVGCDVRALDYACISVLFGWYCAPGMLTLTMSHCSCSVAQLTVDC